MLMADLAVGGRARSRRLAAADPAPPAAPGWPSAGSAPTPPPSSSSSSSATPTRRPGRRASATSSRPTSTTSTTRCSARARVEPLIRRIRNEMAAAGMTVENSKGECNLGQHEINFRYDEALRSADDHAIYKNGAKEIAAQEGHVDHLHGEVQRARGQLVPHPLLARRRGRRQRLRRRPGAVRALRRRPARLHGGADAALRARTSTPTSASPPAPSRRPRSPGAATTAPARCGSSATARGCGSRTGCPAPTSTPTWR